MKKNNVIFVSVFVFLSVIAFGVLAAEYIHAFNFNLGFDSTTSSTFNTINNNQSYNVRLSSMSHDGGESCTWCRLEIKVGRWNGFKYTTTSDFYHSDDNPGWSENIDLGNMAAGKYRYTVRNVNAFNTTGIINIYDYE